MYVFLLRLKPEFLEVYYVTFQSVRLALLQSLDYNFTYFVEQYNRQTISRETNLHLMFFIKFAVAKKHPLAYHLDLPIEIVNLDIDVLGFVNCEKGTESALNPKSC